MVAMIWTTAFSMGVVVSRFEAWRFAANTLTRSFLVHRVNKSAHADTQQQVAASRQLLRAGGLKRSSAKSEDLDDRYLEIFMPGFSLNPTTVLIDSVTASGSLSAIERQLHRRLPPFNLRAEITCGGTRISLSQVFLQDIRRHTPFGGPRRVRMT
jgi:hypothetical protein